MPSSAARLGVLGGTFDPIHYGHLAIAEEARRRYALDAVLFVPASDPPHKPPAQSDAETRYLMTVLGTADHPRFFPSRVEIDRPGPSYTVDTLVALREAFPRAELFLIMGADMALTFFTWCAPDRILELARVVAALRPGYPDEQLARLAADSGMGRIEVMPAPLLDLSGTNLRERVREGSGLRYLTPDAVVAFVEKMSLYR